MYVRSIIDFATVGAGVATKKKMKNEYHHFVNAGFSKLPRGEVTDYHPLYEVGKSITVYVSMFYITEDDQVEILHDNKPVEIKTSWVITRY
jgi:hypothetical protein